jgi:5-methylcytosine-specific restriction endonuclease McrA
MFKRQHIRALQNKAWKAAALAEVQKKTPNQIAEDLRKSGDGFLASTEWKELRHRVLTAYGWTCMCCGAIPKQRRFVNVDHIKPRKRYPELALDFENCQVLCHTCNKRKGNGPSVDYRP